MATELETGKGDCSSTSPGSGEGLGEALTRPLFARAVPPSTRVEPPQAIGERDDLADGRELEGGYPVPGRSPEMNRRIAAHEAGGHGLVARALGSTVHHISIIPANGFAGHCLRSGAPSTLNLLDETPVSTDEVVDVIDVCARLEKLTSQIGSSRVADAEAYIRAQVAVIELVAGRVCEMILFPDHEPLKTAHDLNEAIAFAGVACASRGAVAAMVAYAEAEAAALIRENRDVVEALISAILVRGVLDGAEVDMIIADAISIRAAEIERQRRADWCERQVSASFFIAKTPGAARERRAASRHYAGAGLFHGQWPSLNLEAS